MAKHASILLLEMLNLHTKILNHLIIVVKIFNPDYLR